MKRRVPGLVLESCMHFRHRTNLHLTLHVLPKAQAQPVLSKVLTEWDDCSGPDRTFAPFDKGCLPLRRGNRLDLETTRTAGERVSFLVNLARIGLSLEETTKECLYRKQGTKDESHSYLQHVAAGRWVNIGWSRLLYEQQWKTGLVWLGKNPTYASASLKFDLQATVFIFELWLSVYFSVCFGYGLDCLRKWD